MGQGLLQIWVKLAVGIDPTWRALTESMHQICKKDPQAMISSSPKATAKCFLDEVMKVTAVLL